MFFDFSQNWFSFSIHDISLIICHQIHLKTSYFVKSQYPVYFYFDFWLHCQFIEILIVFLKLILWSDSAKLIILVSFLENSTEFSTQMIMSSEIKSFISSFPIWITFTALSWLISLPKISDNVAKKWGSLRKAFSVSPLSFLLALGFS